MTTPENAEPGQKDPDSRPTEESPVPARDEKFGLNLGNPLESEGAAFSWLVVVLIAAISIGAVAKIISPLAAVICTLILLGVVSVPIFRGLKHQLGSPEDDE